MKILVADDNPDYVTLLRVFLEGQGHNVFAANSGSKALGVARREQPNMIILDVGMPGMSGTDVAAAIRREPWGENVFLVALTGWSTAEDRMATSWAGFDEHLSKPVCIEDVEELVKERAALNDQGTQVGSDPVHD